MFGRRNATAGPAPAARVAKASSFDESTYRAVSSQLSNLHVATIEEVQRRAHMELGRELRYLKLLATGMEELWAQGAPPGVSELVLLQDEGACVQQSSGLAARPNIHADLDNFHCRAHVEFGRELQNLKMLVAGMEELWLRSAPTGFVELPHLLEDEDPQVRRASPTPVHEEPTSVNEQVQQVDSEERRRDEQHATLEAVQPAIPLPTGLVSLAKLGTTPAARVAGIPAPRIGGPWNEGSQQPIKHTQVGAGEGSASDVARGVVASPKGASSLMPIPKGPPPKRANYTSVSTDTGVIDDANPPAEPLPTEPAVATLPRPHCGRVVVGTIAPRVPVKSSLSPNTNGPISATVGYVALSEETLANLTLPPFPHHGEVEHL